MESNKTNAELQKDVSGGTWTQYLATMAVAMLMGITGIQFGWTGPALELLTSDTSPIPLTSSESAWVASCSALGLIASALIGFYICDTIGRKWTLVIGSIPNLLSFPIIYFATNIPMLYSYRILAGFSNGISFLVVPIYIAEISSPSIRGKLGILPEIAYSCGILLEYIIIPSTNLQINAIICLVLGIVQTFVICSIPDTPYFYLMKGKLILAEKTLKWFRQKDSVSVEMKELELGWKLQETSRNGIIDVFKTKTNHKILALVFGIMFVAHFSGLPAISSYTYVILDDANASVSTETGSVIIGVLNIVYSVIPVFLVDKWGRKPLLIVSSVFSAFALIIIGIFFYLKSHNCEFISDISFIPLVGLIIFILAFDIGLGCITVVYASELFATKYVATVTAMLSIFGAICSMIVTHLYQQIGDNYGIDFGFWLFATICILGAIFFAIYLPETKGKTLEEIQYGLQKPLTIKQDNSKAQFGSNRI